MIEESIHFHEGMKMNEKIVLVEKVTNLLKQQMVDDSLEIALEFYNYTRFLSEKHVRTSP